VVALAVVVHGRVSAVDDPDPTSDVDGPPLALRIAA
jgi:hypothetical protein